MARAPKKPASTADLPVLTEQPEADLELPVLTEILAEVEEAASVSGLKSKVKTRSGRIDLTDEQLKQIAGYIAPQVEAMLRKKLSARMNALWPEIWKEVSADLPDMVRAIIIESGRSTRK
jgi:hypothetical protein